MFNWLLLFMSLTEDSCLLRLWDCVLDICVVMVSFSHRVINHMAFTAQRVMRKDVFLMNGDVDALSPGNGFLVLFLSSSYIYSYFSPIISFYTFFHLFSDMWFFFRLFLERISLLWVCRGDPFYAERSHDTVVKNVVNCAACVLALTLAGVNTFERVNLA